MMQAHNVQFEKLSRFEVRGNAIELLFAVVVAALKWSEADAETFAGAACKRHPELVGYKYRKSDRSWFDFALRDQLVAMN